jgi:hypothetical protein
MKWADKKISRSLGRDVTIANESTLTSDNLKQLDSLVLPWMVDTMKVQMLLGRKESLSCIFTAHNHVNCSSTFAVFFDDDEADEDVAAVPDVANPEHAPEVPLSPMRDRVLGLANHMHVYGR